MRHRLGQGRLGCATAQRNTLLVCLAQSLFKHGRIKTTVSRARALRAFAEPLITLAGKDTLHARRRLASVVRDREAREKLLKELGPRFVSRPGGYTRTLKVGYRAGDAAPMALMELVEG